MQEELEKLGLTKHEVRIYLTLLKLGLSPAKPILEETQLHRQFVYDALDKLIEKGLVSFVLQGKRKYFKASSPENFEKIFENKEKEIQIQKTEFQKLLPQLNKLQQSLLQSQEATIYYGNKGIQTLLNDMIEEGKEVLTIGASDSDAESFQYHVKFSLPKFHLQRKENKIPLKILFSEEQVKRSQILTKQKQTSVKVLPKEFTSNMSTNIYGDKISIILWGAQPFGILIKCKEMADAQRKHFNLLWKVAK